MPKTAATEEGRNLTKLKLSQFIRVDTRFI